MPHDHLVRKKALLDYKKWILRSYQIGIVLKGYPMILVKKLKFYICLFLEKMDLEIMSPDHLVRKKALLDYKKWILQSCHIGIFSKGLTHDFRQKLKISYLFVFGQNGH